MSPARALSLGGSLTSEGDTDIVLAHPPPGPLSKQESSQGHQGLPWAVSTAMPLAPVTHVLRHSGKGLQGLSDRRGTGQQGHSGRLSLVLPLRRDKVQMPGLAHPGQTPQDPSGPPSTEPAGCSPGSDQKTGSPTKPPRGCEQRPRLPGRPGPAGGGNSASPPLFTGPPALMSRT